MQEDFLHYVWQFKQFNILSLKTTLNEVIAIKHVGQHNLNSGPDFFNAQLEINNQLWAGNVEIHVKSSDWFLHNHETDKAYDTIILHVVWEHDVDVYRKNNTAIPTLELKHYINKNALNNYRNLFNKKEKWINCASDLNSISNFVYSNWLEKLYLERLKVKADLIFETLKETNNDWETVLFQMLCKNFGLKVNGSSFLQLAKHTNFAVVRKCISNIELLEALLFGQANLLNSPVEDSYFLKLKNEYAYLCQKFKLKNSPEQVQFFRLRPNNFPTLRLSQLANLYHSHKTLFHKIIETNSLEDFYAIFNVSTSDYWETHYNFGKTSAKSKKKLSKPFIDLILINTIIPIKFAYSNYLGKHDYENLLQLMNALKGENNTIVSKFNSLKKIKNTALNTQAILQLKTNYCDKNKCLQCAVGNVLLRQND